MNPSIQMDVFGLQKDAVERILDWKKTANKLQTSANIKLTSVRCTFLPGLHRLSSLPSLATLLRHGENAIGLIRLWPSHPGEKVCRVQTPRFSRGEFNGKYMEIHWVF